MYSDCWGAVGWTVVDYYLRKKPSYYFVRRAFEPVLASIEQEDRHLAFCLSNDTLRDVEGRLEYGLVGLQDSELQEHTIGAVAPANSSVRAAELDVNHLVPGETGRWAAYCRFVAEGQTVSLNRRFLAGFRFNSLEMPKARFSHRLDDDVLVFKADSYVWQIRIEAPAGLEADDNYFDLLPGEERRIQMRGPKAFLPRAKVTALNE
jgi:beta-mannosidase